MKNCTTCSSFINDDEYICPHCNSEQPIDIIEEIAQTEEAPTKEIVTSEESSLTDNGIVAESSSSLPQTSPVQSYSDISRNIIITPSQTTTERIAATVPTITATNKAGSIKNWTVKTKIIAALIAIAVLLTVIITPIVINKNAEKAATEQAMADKIAAQESYKLFSDAVFEQCSNLYTSLTTISDAIYSCWHDAIYNGDFNSDINVAISFAQAIQATNISLCEEYKQIAIKKFKSIDKDKIPDDRLAHFTKLKAFFLKAEEYYDFVIDVSGSFKTFSERLEPLKKECKTAQTACMLETI